jgi:PAS domain S-box-containing protein
VAVQSERFERGERIDVGSGAGAVPAARRRAATAVREAVHTDVLDALELVISELASNALLHGAAPVTLVVAPGRDGSSARVEVHDGSRTLPVRPRRGGDGLTGRGLALIDAVAAAWGVDATPEGKAVWVELSPESVRAAEPTDVDTEELLAGFEAWPEQDGPPRYTVTLGDVPTDLLLSAKAHVDSVVRELALSEAGAASGMSAALPPHLARLVHDVTREWSEARQAIKRQAVAAAERGEQRTTLVLTLPAEAAEAGERYLAALEQADTYGRASRLLTLAAPPQHRAFRRWYVTALVDGVRRAAAGEKRVTAPSFETHLLREIDHLAALQQVSERSARLQRVTAALSGALDQAAVAQTVLTEAAADLAALRGVLLVRTPVGAPRPAASTGYSPELLAALADGWGTERTPGLVAWDTSTSVWLESRSERDESFPGFASLEPDAAASCAVPLTVAGRLVGVLVLSFLESRLFADDERAFVRALAAVAAQAMDRADLYEQQAEVADRLARLQEVTAALAGADSLDDVLDVTIEHATGLVGAYRAALCLVRDDGRSVETRRMVPSLGEDHDGWSVFSLDLPVPVAEAVRTGELVVAEDVAERDARWPSLAHYARDREHSLVVLPLHGEGGASVGAVSLSFSTDTGGAPDRSFLMAFADACGQAVGRARAAERAREGAARLAFLARASSELASSLDVERTLAGVARLAVPDFADWCVVHLVQDGDLRALAVEHADPAKTQLAWSVQERWPQRLNDPTGVAEVVRTGEPVLVEDIPALQAEMDASGVPTGQDPEHAEIMRSLGLNSAIIVPLAARGRTLGALTLITAESRRQYDPDDLAFAVDLAGRAAVALDNARLFAEASERLAVDLPPDAAPNAVESALRAAEVGRFVLHLTDDRLESDERLATFFGFTPDDTSGQFADFIARMHPDDAPRVLAAVADSVARRADYAMEHRVVLPSGQVRWLTVRGRVLLDDRGEPAQLAGVAYDTTHAHDARERTARLLETMSDAFFRLDRDWRFTYVNTQAERLLFRGREELLGRDLWQEYPDAVGSQFETRYRRAAETGLPATFEEHFSPLAAWFEVRASPDSEGLSVFFHDITSRKLAEQQREAAAARLALLSEATRALVGALDPGTLLDRIAHVLVPELGEWAIAGLLDADGGLLDARAAHVDQAASARLSSLVRDRPAALGAVPRIARLLRSGRPELVLHPDPSVTRSAGEDVPELLRRFGLGSALLVPLQATDTTLGVIAVVNGPDRPPFTPDDLTTATDIGNRAGLALQNALLFERQRTAVEVLQRSMLSEVPQPDGVELTARYRAAAQEAQVGGDWYDAFLQPDGATVVVIGDVIGHDLGAAAAMGQLRSLLRGTAYDRQETPARVLSRVDGALRGLQIETLATALVARLEQTPVQVADGARTLRWSSAGHPPAMIRRADGTVEVLAAEDDLLLGLDPAAERHDSTLELRPGDTVLLYTDGLVERRDSALSDGLDRLEATLAEVGGLPIGELCDVLLSRLLPPAPDDDVALVALRAQPVAAVLPPPRDAPTGVADPELPAR